MAEKEIGESDEDESEAEDVDVDLIEKARVRFPTTVEFMLFIWHPVDPYEDLLSNLRGK